MLWSSFCYKIGSSLVVQLHQQNSYLVRMKGLEPSRLTALVPKTSVSTIPPHPRYYYCTKGSRYCLSERTCTKLDLRKIVRSQSELSRAKTVLSEGEVAIATSREEKQFVADRIRSGD